MSESGSFRSAMFWGVGAILSALFFLFIKFFLNPGVPVSISYFLLNFVTFLYTLTIVMHMRGYLAVSREVRSPLLFWSTIVLMVGYGLMGTLICIALQFHAPSLTASYANGLLGMCLTLSLACIAVFLYALYRAVGISALSVSVFLLSIFSFWTPWLTAILFIPSTYYFFIRSKL